MPPRARVALVLLRLTMGWLFLYAGVTKIVNPAWSATGYLANAKTFPTFYTWLASPGNIGWVNTLNEWGLTLIGIALILGIGVRLAATLGAALMLLYYFPVLEFPRIPSHSYLVDEHIVYAAALLVLAAFRAGRVWGLDRWCAGLPWCSRHPTFRALFG